MVQGEMSRESLTNLSEGGVNGLKSYSPVQLFFLMRLSYLQRQRRECVNVIDHQDWRMRVLNKALYSTFQDCEREGVGGEAKTLLQQQPPQAN
jgi:hypothetical protein